MVAKLLIVILNTFVSLSAGSVKDLVKWQYYHINEILRGAQNDGDKSFATISINKIFNF